MITTVKRSAGTKTKAGAWRVRISVTDEFGRTKQKGFEAKTLIGAQTKARLWEAKHGRKINTGPGAGTLKDAIEYTKKAVWIHTTEKHQTEMARYASYWTKDLGDCLISDITAPILTKTIEKMGLKSASAINKCSTCIKQVFAYAISDLGWIERNAANDLRKPEPDTSTKKIYPPMTSEEYDRVLKLAEPRVQLMIRLTGECGLRPSEANRVRPEHLSSIRDRWMLGVDRSKTVAGIRSIPVPDTLATMILNWNESDWEGISDPSDHVRHWWRENSKTRFYDLRGWYADQLRRRGISSQVRTYLIGHTDPKFTQKVYESIIETDLLDAFYPKAPTKSDSGVDSGVDSNSG